MEDKWYYRVQLEELRDRVDKEFDLLKQGSLNFSDVGKP